MNIDHILLGVQLAERELCSAWGTHQQTKALKNHPALALDFALRSPPLAVCVCGVLSLLATCSVYARRLLQSWQAHSGQSWQAQQPPRLQQPVLAGAEGSGLHRDSPTFSTRVSIAVEGDSGDWI